MILHKINLNTNLKILLSMIGFSVIMFSSALYAYINTSTYSANSKPNNAHAVINTNTTTSTVTVPHTTSPNLTVIPEYSDYQLKILFDKTNEYRISKGINPLKRNIKLDNSACAKAIDMDDKDYWSHDAPDGTKYFKFIYEQNYKSSITGENLAENFSNIDKIVPAWIKSPEHEKNLSDTRFVEVGYCIKSVSIPEAKSGIIINTVLIVQHFASSL